MLKRTADTVSLISIVLLLTAVAIWDLQFNGGTTHASDAIPESSPSVAELEALIEGARPGEVVHLPDGEHRLRRTIKIPSHVTIMGGPASAILYDAGEEAYALDASDTDGVAIKNIVFHLDGHAGGITAKRAANLRIQGNAAIGRIYHHEGPRSPGGYPIYVDDSRDILVVGNVITNTFGGIYALNSSRVEISSNMLDHANFGQIVVSGHNFDVSSNEVFSSGIPNKAGTISRQGDAFTSFGLSGARLRDNLFFGSYCYQASFFLGPNTGVEISGNVMAYGITSAIHFPVPAQNITIVNNTFIRNAGAAVAADAPVESIEISRNNFIGDGLFFGDRHQELLVINNLGLTEVAESLRLRDLVLGTKLFMNLPDSAQVTLTDAQPPDENASSILNPIAEVKANAHLSLKQYLPAGNTLQVVAGSPIDGGMELYLDGNKQSGIITLSQASSELEAVAGMEDRYEHLFVRAWHDRSSESEWQRVTIHTTGERKDIFLAEWPHSFIWRSEEINEITTVSTADFYGLLPNVKNLRLEGDALQGFGNGHDNIIYGNEHDNIIDGGAGDDTIIVGGGYSNNLYGGSGSDTFVFDGQFGFSNVLDFEKSEDKVQFRNTKLNSFQDVLDSAAEGGGATLITYGEKGSVLLGNTLFQDLRPEMFLFTPQ